MLDVRVVVDLATEPVTVEEAKAFLVIDADYTADDELIEGLITAARDLLEKYTNKSFGEKTLEVFTDKSHLDLPYGPIVDIESVTDQDAIAITDYSIKGLDYKTIYFRGGSLENYYQRNKDQICDTGVVTGHYVSYTTGYGSEGVSPLPPALKLAIKEQVREFYNNRGTDSEEINLTAKVLADPYCRRSWI